MKKILFINGFIYLPGESAIKRTFYLFDMMLKMGYDVSFLTSDFNHYSKESRDIEKFYAEHSEYRSNIHFLHMTPYTKNLSVKRYLSGNRFEKDAVKWFAENGKDFDVVYLTIPAVIIAKDIRKYCDAFGTKLVIDVNDLFPDSLKLILKNEHLYNIATYPIRRNVRIGYSNADGIIAVSEEYLEIAARVNQRATKHLSVYIGAMLDKFDAGVSEYGDTITKPEGEFWITYIGTLGASYDLCTVIQAVDRLQKEKKLNIRFKVLGQGPALAEMQSLVKKLDATSVDFLGFVDYAKMAAYLNKTDFCVNCIKVNASQSIINKAADYFASGNPVLNCGSCEEMKMLVQNNHAGINYEAENAESLMSAILWLCDHPEEAAAMGKNARILAEEKFDRYKTHLGIVNMLDAL